MGANDKADAAYHPGHEAEVPSSPEADGPIYPEITVHLTGQDGNGFIIASRVRGAISRHLRFDAQARGLVGGELARAYKEAEDQAVAFFDEALKGDYDHLLATAMKWVSVD